jgi:hypothetical protein
MIAPPRIAAISQLEPLLVITPRSLIASVKIVANMIEFNNPHVTSAYAAVMPVNIVEEAVRTTLMVAITPRSLPGARRVRR